MMSTSRPGILVVDEQGELSVTVATHGFETDRLIHHPNPISGSFISKIVRNLPGTDISVAKLNTDLRYTNPSVRNRRQSRGRRN